MEEFKHLREYSLFLNWLKQKSPRIYNKYGRFFLVPDNQHGVRVLRDHLSETVFKKLLRLGARFHADHKL